MQKGVIGALAVMAACRGTEPPAPTPTAAASTSVPAVVATPPPAPVPAPEVERVVIISEDGLRPDVLTAKLAPRHVALIATSTIAREAETIAESDTLPSHA